MGKVLAGLFGVILFAAAASAQAVLKVTEGVLQVGQTVDISYSDPSNKGGVVTVEIDNGERPEPTIIEICIHLDGAGNGSAKWVVPAWWTAAFNAPGANEVMRCIDCPDDAGSLPVAEAVLLRE